MSVTKAGAVNRGTVSTISSVAILAVVLAGLVGCSQTGSDDAAPSDQSTMEQSDAGSDDDGSSSAGGCPVPKEADLQPFSSDLVTEPIPDGAVYGDGSELSFTTSLGEGLYPSYELLYFVDDALTVNTGGNWEDTGGGTYTNNLNVFDSDLDGQPGYIEVSAFPEGVTFDGERYDGDELILGIYCITYAVQ
ncbi:MAG: hypothetical protein ACOH19_15690 [Rhodoglobus sp.]